MIVFGIDSGLATFGIAAVDLAGTPRLVDAGVFTSEPSKKKLNVRSQDDLARRVRELSAYVETWTKAHNPIALCLEAPSWPRAADASAKLGAAFGVVYTTAQRLALPLVQALPVDVKLAVCRSKKATKDDVIAAVERLHPDVCWPSRTGLWEHVADAIAVVHACLDSDTLRMARRLSA